MQNLVAFSEYINFKSLKGQIFSQNPQNLGAASTIKYTAPERAAEDRIEINAKIMMNGCLGRHCNHDIKPFLFHLHGTNFVAHNWDENFLNFMRSYLAKLLMSYNFFFQIVKFHICRGLFMKLVLICINPKHIFVFF